VSKDGHILSANVIRFDIFATFPQGVKTDTMGNVIWRYDHPEKTESVSSLVVELSNGNIVFAQVVDLSVNEEVIKLLWVS